MGAALTPRSRSREVVVAPDVASTAAERIAGILGGAIAARGLAAIALAGGRTPAPAYHRLAARTDVDWRRVRVYFGDERVGPPGHPDSNYRMVRDALLDRIDGPAPQVYPLEGDARDLDLAARTYEAALPDALDLIVLGIGRDGHTASLFPGHPALAERVRLVLPVSAPVAPASRLTVTPPVIGRARARLVIGTGADKAPAVARALADRGTIEECPARLAADGVWILDAAASSGRGAA